MHEWIQQVANKPFLFFILRMTRAKLLFKTFKTGYKRHIKAAAALWSYFILTGKVWLVKLSQNPSSEWPLCFYHQTSTFNCKRETLMLSKCSVIHILKVIWKYLSPAFDRNVGDTRCLITFGESSYLFADTQIQKGLEITDPRRFRWPWMMSSLSSVRWRSEIIQKLYSFFTTETRMNGVSSVWGKEEHRRLMNCMYYSIQSLVSLILVHPHIYKEAYKICITLRVLVDAQDEVISCNHDTYSYILCICPQIMVLRLEYILDI